MRIETVVSHEYIDTVDLDGRTIVVIDTLRATSVMVTAMMNGARSLRIVREVEEALALRRENPAQNYLLGGERKGLRLPEFDLTNSPLEYTKERIHGRNIVMSTSNGTLTMVRIGKDRDILIASLLNHSAVAKEVRRLGKDTVIVNSGTMGRLSLEDFITGGAIAAAFKDEELCDTTLASVLAYENSSADRQSLMEKGLHYRRMLELEYLGDIEYCFRENITDIVPVMRNSIITEVR